MNGNMKNERQNKAEIGRIFSGMFFIATDAFDGFAYCTCAGFKIGSVSFLTHEEQNIHTRL